MLLLSLFVDVDFQLTNLVCHVPSAQTSVLLSLIKAKFQNYFILYVDGQVAKTMKSGGTSLVLTKEALKLIFVLWLCDI